MNIVPFEISYQQQCEAVIASLPTWFGIPESNAGYMANLSRFPSWVAIDDSSVTGTVTVERHFPDAYELHYIAVHAGHHRRGIGRALMLQAEDGARSAGGEWMHVKTLGPSHPDAGYVLTRKFYVAMGYQPLFETHDLWPGNPALISVKKL